MQKKKQKQKQDCLVFPLPLVSIGVDTGSLVVNAIVRRIEVVLLEGKGKGLQRPNRVWMQFSMALVTVPVMDFVKPVSNERQTRLQR